MNKVERNTSNAEKDGEHESLSDVVNSMIGKEVTVNTKDGEAYTGILKGCNSKMDIVLNYSRKNGSGGKSTRTIDDIRRRVQFKSRDVVSMHIPMIAIQQAGKSNKRKIQAENGFAIDAEICKSKSDSNIAEKKFEEWVTDECFKPNLFFCNAKANRVNSVGYRQKTGQIKQTWDPEDMIKANEKLGVQKSTFREDLSQYTNVEATGTAQDRERANQIANSIENDALSRRNALLENDDEECDLSEPKKHEEFQAVTQQEIVQAPSEKGSYHEAAASPCPSSSVATPFVPAVSVVHQGVMPDQNVHQASSIAHYPMINNSFPQNFPSAQQVNAQAMPYFSNVIPVPPPMPMPYITNVPYGQAGFANPSQQPFAMMPPPGYFHQMPPNVVRGPMMPYQNFPPNGFANNIPQSVAPPGFFNHQQGYFSGPTTPNDNYSNYGAQGSSVPVNQVYDGGNVQHTAFFSNGPPHMTVPPPVYFVNSQAPDVGSSYPPMSYQDPQMYGGGNYQG